MRKVGFELEMSDILTQKAAEIVYGDLDLWVDRWSGYTKPELDYTKWNLQSDGTIKNSNGTKCMSSYELDGKLHHARNGKKSPDRFLWQGAELLSPILTDDSWKEQFDVFVGKFIEARATFNPDNQISIHVHVDISDFTFDEVKMIPKLVFNQQRALDLLGNDWRGRSFYTLHDVEVLSQAKYWEDYVHELCRDRRLGRVYEITSSKARRIVNTLPYFEHKKTVEFRCFLPIPDTNYITDCFNLCIDLVESWKKGEPLDQGKFKEHLARIDFYQPLV